MTKKTDSSTASNKGVHYAYTMPEKEAPAVEDNTTEAASVPLEDLMAKLKGL